MGPDGRHALPWSSSCRPASRKSWKAKVLEESSKPHRPHGGVWQLLGRPLLPPHARCPCIARVTRISFVGLRLEAPACGGGEAHLRMLFADFSFTVTVTL